MPFLVDFFNSRAHPAQDADWGRMFGGGLESHAGVDVTVEGALELPAFWACVRVLSETVASLPLFVYERMDRGKRRAMNHPLYMILHGYPNTEQTRFRFMQLMMNHLATWGNGYAEIERNRAGQVMGLWPLRPDRMRMVREAGRLRYIYLRNDGIEHVFAAEQVLHIRGLSGDGMVGYSPVRVAMQAIGLGLATEEFGSKFFGNGARPGVVLQHPGTLTEESMKNLKESWQSMYGGLSQAHRTAILEEGMTAEVIGVPPEEAQFLQTRTFQAQEIARIFRMQPHKIGLLEDATFSNIEHQAIEFVADTIAPYLVNIEQEMMFSLMTPAERERYLVEFLVDGLLRGDVTARTAAYTAGRQGGWLSVNDIREMENMDAIEGGDEYLSPLNMAVVGEEADDEVESDTEGTEGTEGAERAQSR
jgi:HK97 family phage portal protein